MSDDKSMTCGKVVHFGGGDRYSNTYCDWLPDGHDGSCIDRRDPGRMAEAWSASARAELAALRERIGALCDEAERGTGTPTSVCLIWPSALRRALGSVPEPTEGPDKP